MARISIPLDAITSRFNLGERFNTVRSQSIASRFANIKPISEFFDIKRLSKPGNFSEIQTRVNYNLGYFSSNYAVVFVMLSIYSLITNLLLLFVIIMVIGGMWGIGKLGGADLDIGVVRATSSQLYTGLVCVAVPLTFFASPIATFLWLIGATGTNRECFFRGGGLGGRPRTPYDVPSWGRPPGARLGRKRDKWGRQQSWEYDERFEELDDTDEDGLHGVPLDRGYAQKRFTSDELRFDGIDLGSSRARQRHSGPNYEDDSDYSEGAGYDYELRGRGSSGLQLMLREKEDILIDRARERIARARSLGKTNVKLSQEEIDALNRADRKQRPAVAPAPLPAPKTAPKSKKTVPARTRTVERKKSSKSDKSASNSPKVKAIEPRSRGRSTNSNREDAIVPYPLLPEESYGSSSGVLMRAPQGYYGPPVPTNRPDSGRGSRTNSNQSLRQAQQHPQPLPYHQHPYFQGQGRYYSNPDTMQVGRPSSASSRASRPDPSEPDWEPRAHSNSSLVEFPIDQLPNPTQTFRAPRFDPSDLRFASPTARRVVSGPPSTYPPARYRHPQDELFLPDHSDSTAMYEDYPEQRTPSEDDDEDDGEDGQGVQAELLERPSNDYRIQTRSGVTARGGQAKGRRRGR